MREPVVGRCGRGRDATDDPVHAGNPRKDDSQGPHPASSLKPRRRGGDRRQATAACPRRSRPLSLQLPAKESDDALRSQAREPRSPTKAVAVVGFYDQSPTSVDRRLAPRPGGSRRACRPHPGLGHPARRAVPHRRDPAAGTASRPSRRGRTAPQERSCPSPAACPSRVAFTAASRRRDGVRCRPGEREARPRQEAELRPIKERELRPSKGGVERERQRSGPGRTDGLAEVARVRPRAHRGGGPPLPEARFAI